MIAIKRVNILLFYEIIFQFILLCRKILPHLSFHSTALREMCIECASKRIIHRAPPPRKATRHDGEAQEEVHIHRHV
jgi:hypothetical protein